jgi:hypothetical protein
LKKKVNYFYCLEIEIPLSPFLNLIAGRTKVLKSRIKLDKTIKFKAFKVNYKEFLFEEEEFSKVLQNRFFNFIMDIEIPKDICLANNVLIPNTFLKKELKLFKIRLITNEEKD